MSEMINQYELLEPFQNKNAGFSRWTYAKKNNKDYLLNRFTLCIFAKTLEPCKAAILSVRKVIMRILYVTRNLCAYMM